MKTNLHLLIEKDLVNQIKEYADRCNMSVSELVETYFIKLLSYSKRSSVIDLIESLPKPNIPDDMDLKAAYYEQRAAKDGF